MFPMPLKNVWFSSSGLMCPRRLRNRAANSRSSIESASGPSRNARAGRSFPKQPAGHAEMDRERLPDQIEQQEFPAPLDRANHPAAQPLSRLLRTAAHHQPRVEVRFDQAPPTEVRRQRAQHSLDFRQFGHSSSA